LVVGRFRLVLPRASIDRKIVKGFATLPLNNASSARTSSAKTIFRQGVATLASGAIFRMKKGEYVWLEATMTLDDAEARVQELGAAEPREYVIFNEKTCDRISLIVEHRQKSKAQ
jgi:hypothetical protein